MTIYLNTGQFMRLTAPHTDCERRYFVSTNYWPHISHMDGSDNLLWEADPSGKVYDPDVFVDDGTWVEFTDYIHDDATTFQELSDGEVTKWVLTVEGHNFDSRYIIADHPLLVFYRLWTDVEQVDWSEWHLLCIGYFKADSIAQDYTDPKLWQATVEGISQYMEKRLAPPETFTRTDIALNQPVTTSDLLQDMRLEVNKGEFLGLPTNSGQNLVDGDDAVPCIWDNEPTPAPEPLVYQKQDGQLRINEVFLRPAIGIPNGYQWVEIFNTDPHNSVVVDDRSLAFYDQNEVRQGILHLKEAFDLGTGQGWTPSGSALAADMYGGDSTNIAITNPANLGIHMPVRIEGEEMTMASDKVSPATFARPNNPLPGNFHPSGATIEKQGDVTQGGANTIPPHGFLIVCENRRRFEEMFRVPAGTLITEWTDIPGLKTLRLDETAGHLRLFTSLGVDGAIGNGTREPDRVYWGNAEQPIAEWTASSIQTVIFDAPDDVGRTVWNGARIPVPTYGHSIKRKVAGGGVGALGVETDSAADWMDEDVPTPGRTQAAMDSDGNRIIEDTAWASVQLPNLTCELTEDLDNDDTTATVNNTDGFFSNREQNILIITTVTPYTAKTATTFTLTSAWSGGNIPAGTRLYPMDSQGVAHDSWPISTIQLVRKQNPTPAIFSLYTSTIESPLYPSADEAWKEEWAEWVHVSGDATIRLKESIDDGDTSIVVDRTSGAPLAGYIIVKTPDPQTNEDNYFTVQYTSRTYVRFNLKEPWNYGFVPVTDDTVITALTNNPLTSVFTVQEPRRARHVLFLMDAMSDLGRGKLNAIRVYPNMAATTNPDVAVDGASVVDFVRHLLVNRFGLPSGKFGAPQDSQGNYLYDVTLLSLSTAEDTYMNILRDFARKTGMHIRFSRADGIRWRPAPEHPWGAVTGDEEEIDFTFEPDHAIAMQIQREETATVRRAVIHYKLTGTNDVGAAWFPMLPATSDSARVYTHPDTIVVPDASIAQYMAEMLFRRLAAPVTMTLVLPFFAWDWLHPLARVIVDWNFDAHPDDPFRKYFYVVETLDCRIEGDDRERTPLTTLTMRRLKKAGGV